MSSRVPRVRSSTKTQDKPYHLSFRIVEVVRGTGGVSKTLRHLTQVLSADCNMHDILRSSECIASCSSLVLELADAPLRDALKGGQVEDDDAVGLCSVVQRHHSRGQEHGCPQRPAEGVFLGTMQRTLCSSRDLVESDNAKKKEKNNPTPSFLPDSNADADEEHLQALHCHIVPYRSQEAVRWQCLAESLGAPGDQELGIVLRDCVKEKKRTPNKRHKDTSRECKESPERDDIREGKQDQETKRQKKKQEVMREKKGESLPRGEKEAQSDTQRFSICFLPESARSTAGLTAVKQSVHAENENRRGEGQKENENAASKNAETHAARVARTEQGAKCGVLELNLQMETCSETGSAREVCRKRAARDGTAKSPYLERLQGDSSGPAKSQASATEHSTSPARLHSTS